MLTIVLASSSPYRRELLSRFKLPFDVFSPDIDETPHMDEKAKDISFRLAREKAFKVAPHYANSLIIGKQRNVKIKLLKNQTHMKML
jgi:septum formation protein